MKSEIDKTRVSKGIGGRQISNHNTLGLGSMGGDRETTYCMDNTRFKSKYCALLIWIIFSGRS